MLNTSVVLYNHSVAEIESLVNSLRQSAQVKEVFLLDNSPIEHPEFNTLEATYIFNNKNIGYGAAHNIAIRKSIQQNRPYHLVINPDITFDPEILNIMVDYMTKHLAVGQLMPKVLYPNGQIQYLCKLIPTPFDLIFRRFLPKKCTTKRTEKFELRGTGYDKIMNVPYLSGCFMLLSTKALKEVGLFDERFFMYPEDIDLTRRIHKKFETLFFPNVFILHHHAQDSYLNFKMLMIHTVNMIKYFNKWGWIFDKERKEINKATLKKLFQ